jgi:hypothetical protein
MIFNVALNERKCFRWKTINILFELNVEYLYFQFVNGKEPDLV